MAELGCEHVKSPAGIVKILALIFCLLGVITIGAGFGICDFIKLCGPVKTNMSGQAMCCPFIIIMIILALFFIIDFILRSAYVYNCSNGTLYNLDMIFLLLAACLAWAVTTTLLLAILEELRNENKQGSSGRENLDENFNVIDIKAAHMFLGYNESVLRTATHYTTLPTHELSKINSTDKYIIENLKNATRKFENTTTSTFQTTSATDKEIILIPKINMITYEENPNYTSKYKNLLKSTTKILGYRKFDASRYAKNYLMKRRELDEQKLSDMAWKYNVFRGLTGGGAFFGLLTSILFCIGGIVKLFHKPKS